MYCISSTGTCTPSTTVNATSGTAKISTEGRKNYICGYAIDNADNKTNPTVCKGPFLLDKQDPTMSFTNNITVNQSAGSTYDVKSGVTISDNISTNSELTLTATSTLNFATPSTYVVTYTLTDLSGRTTTANRNITIVDDIKPTISVTSACSLNGTNGWCRGTQTAQVSASDNSSGIGYYQYSTDNVNWSNYSGPNKEYSSDTSQIVYFRVIDGAGNPSDSTSIGIYRDGTPPSCTTSVSSGTAGTNGWWKTHISLLGSCSDSLSQCTGNASYNVTWEVNGQDYSPGTVYDYAGNSTSCPNYYTKVDTIAPTVGEGNFSVTNEGLYNPSKPNQGYNVYITMTGVDYGSGIDHYETWLKPYRGGTGAGREVGQSRRYTNVLYMADDGRDFCAYAIDKAGNETERCAHIKV